ncbi:helix-turn-helix domain-containing protein [Streptomyces johnsoniae]|uniref:Helix-turn-helix domain-containing protein n=1 Tax=Streptomyces johnsoniae TaxID=3075532 RepID=A0ABU2SCH6_9ACTN|nr:helix-turn-helix domain-containing protein [Streptomyces sp. DSM 41886]MDT0446666.1 helix-turn-helix domain-containing protein [Streptomyces sp. DSM 41886]
MPDRTGVGARIQELRAIRGYSLAQLSQRAHVSVSQLSRVETGKRYASPTITAAVARALGVGVSVLRGQPYIHMLQKEHLDALLSPISSALDSWDLPPDGEPAPRSLDVLEAELRRIVDLRVRTEFATIAERLPALIIEAALSVQLHGRPGHDRERAFGIQAEVARSAAIIAYRLGYMDLSRLALTRMAIAAPQSGDPRQVAVERYERAHITHAESSRPDRGVALMRLALRDLDDDGAPATRAIRGTLQLRAAILAATLNDRSGADDWMGQAAELADAVGETTDYAMAFGPLNVALNEMATRASREDYDGALRVASRVRLPEDYAPTRAAGFWVEKAKSETWTARLDDAIESLHQAQSVAPQLTRYHPGVHETVGTLLRARPRPTARLREFAQWSGV